MRLKGELILFSHRTCQPARAGEFTACHTDCLEDTLCPHLSHNFHCSPGTPACKLISGDSKGLSSLIKCKICLTALEDLRLLHLFFMRSLFELQSEIAVAVREREGGDGHGLVILSVGKAGPEALSMAHKGSYNVALRVILHCKTK